MSRKSVFAKRLRTLISHHGLSQADVADYLGQKQGAVSNWKTGKHLPASPSLLKLAELFGVSGPSLIDEAIPFKLDRGDSTEVVLERLRLARSRRRASDGPPGPTHATTG